MFGGADFGGGVWDVVARGPRREQQRSAIAEAMGPVWEANHVWLIFVVVILFSAFPRLFAALFTGLYVPIGIVLIGIVMRGASFVFRNYVREIGGSHGAWSAVFSVSSIVSPFVLGACAGVIASGGIRRSAAGEVDVVGAGTWLAAFPLVCGALALALCAYLAAVYLTVETTGQVREDFRVRALAAGGGGGSPRRARPGARRLARAARGRRPARRQGDAPRGCGGRRRCDLAVGDLAAARRGRARASRPPSCSRCCGAGRWPSGRTAWCPT